MRTSPPNPFKGLRPYSQDDQDKLFGRDRDLILMKDRIFSGRTTLLFAGSGVGKTSFLNAKVIPELKEQCVVVWHNRWTNTDDFQDTDFSDEEKVTWRSPLMLGRLLAGKMGLWKKKEGRAQSTSPQPAEEQKEDPLNREVKKALFGALRHGERNPGEPFLPEVLARFKKPEPSGPEPARASTPLPSSAEPVQRCILILDQFEEIFQYHSYEEYFSRFLDELCQVINQDSYQVRVVFSMREEFLGELSAFDNRIPDLFSNYYRLKYPDKADAKLIIKRTCAIEGIKPDEEKLNSFVEDLSKFEKGSVNFSKRAVSEDGENAKHVIKRDFVAPPYLQIACERLWNKQYEVKEPDGKSSASGNNDDASHRPFLADYKTGDRDPEEPGGDAQRALRSFCEEKLSERFLTSKELDLASRAFDFLVTKQGAKMAYELTNLAEHMDTPVAPLKATLEKLSDERTHILRESRGPDHSYWFELYHDMYATIVEEWKLKYQRTRKSIFGKKLMAAGLATIVLSLLIGYLLVHFLFNPLLYRSTLVEFKSNLDKPDVQQQENYPKALAAYKNLSNTLGWRGQADSLWADIWERRAQLYKRAQNRDAALLSLLQAAEFRPGGSQRSLQDAAQLVGSDYRSLVTTYYDDCTAAALSSDGRNLLVHSTKGEMKLFDVAAGDLRSTLCDNCLGGFFSADGKTMLTVNTEREEMRATLYETDSLRIITSKSLEGTTDTQTPDAGRNAQEDNASGPVGIRALAYFKSHYLIAGVQGKQIVIWKEDGKRFGSALSLSDDRLSSITLTFSSDGLYLIAAPLSSPAQFFKVTDVGIVPDKRVINKDARALTFSPDGKLLLYIDNSRTGIHLLNLEKSEFLPVPQTFDGTLATVGFSPDGEQYYTQERTKSGGVIRIWDTQKGVALYSPLLSPTTSGQATLGPGGKTILKQSGLLNIRNFELLDIQTGNTLGTIQLVGISRVVGIVPDGQSVTAILGSSAGLWKPMPPEGQAKVFDTRGDGTPLLSRNGRTLLTFNSDSRVQLWDAENGKALGPPVNHGAKSIPAALSPDGKYVATADDDKNVRFWPVDRPEQATALPVADEVTDIAFSRDNKYLSIATSNDVAPPYKVYVWETSSLSTPAVFNTTNQIDSLIFSPDDKYLAIKPWNDFSLEDKSTPASPTVFDIQKREEIKFNEQQSDEITDVKFSSDGKLITGSKNKTASIWELASRRRIKVLENECEVSSVAFSPDAGLSLTGCEDGFVRLWDVATGAKRGEWHYPSAVWDVDFSPDGKMVIVVTDSWVHFSTADEQGLHYLNSRFLSGRWIGPPNIVQDDGKKLRFITLGLRTVSVRDIELDIGDSVKALEGDPAKLLELWQKKLWLGIATEGQLVKRSPSEKSY